MIAQAPDALHALRSSPVFRALPESTLAGLAAKAKLERYESRTQLAARGGLLESFRYVVSGSVNLSLSSVEGVSGTLPILPGKWATWLGCFMKAPLPHDLWSSKSAVLIAFPLRDVRAVLSQSPDALLRVIDELGEIQRSLVIWNLATTAFSPEKRLAYFLFKAFSGELLVNPDTDATAITQEEIGHFGFGSRQRVARLLRELEGRGLLELKYGAIGVPSLEKLQKFAFS
jgi:CRP/FNR family transcriptional regulator, cyclic AMP receptor protein